MSIPTHTRLLKGTKNGVGKPHSSKGTYRERLLKNGFIQEVMKGWHIPARPGERAEDSTAWYASFWDFCAAYLRARFDNEWCLSPEQSLSLHGGNRAVPRQLLVRTSKGGNKPTSLLHGTSIFDMRLNMPREQDSSSTRAFGHSHCQPR